MNLLVVQETDWLKRGPHQQHHLFERLSTRGHRVTVLDYPILRPHWPHEPILARRKEVANAARIYDNAHIHLITPLTVSIKPLARPTSVLSHYKELAGHIEANRPDVIISYALSTGLPAMWLARRHGIPFVFHVIDALHAIVPSHLLKPVANQVEQWLFSTSDQVVLINEHLRDYAVRMGADPTRARVLRTGVDLERIQPTTGDAPDRQQIRARFGVRPDDLLLFFMGWLYDFSGVREVAASLPAVPSHVRLLVAGDGDDYQALCQMRDRELGEQLIMAGRVPYEHIPAYLAAADVLLLPFHLTPATEHIVPIKLYEYMASGKPVIASPLPGVMRDVGSEGGVTYASASDQAQTALSIHEHAGELGQQARQFVEENCDWRAITGEFEQLLAHHAAHGAAS